MNRYCAEITSSNHDTMMDEVGGGWCYQLKTEIMTHIFRQSLKCWVVMYTKVNDNLVISEKRIIASCSTLTLKSSSPGQLNGFMLLH